MSKIGYIRVSTEHQETARQQEIMCGYQVDRIFSEKLSGANTDRPQLDRLANGKAPQHRPSLRSVKLTNENSTLSETLREGALLLLCIIWVSADYGICHNADFDLCGTVLECANRLNHLSLLPEIPD